MAGETGFCINPTRFKRMISLKFLKIYNNFTGGGSKVCMVDNFDYLPPLRYLHWEAYSLKYLPSNFKTDYLVEINLSDSSVETLWSECQELGNLRHLKLNRCRNLIEIPDLSKARSLECLCLCYCESLVELHSSLGDLDKLVTLSMNHCKKLKNLPCNIYLKSLKTLKLDGCTNIQEFPLVSNNIETLGLSFTSIELVPDSINRLSKLMELRLSYCKRLKNLPDTIRCLDSLVHLTLGITVFPVLGNRVKILSLNGTAIEQVPSSIGEKLNLSCLDMSECKRLQNLPHTLSKVKTLRFLNLRGCINITEIPHVPGDMRRFDLYGTLIEKYEDLSDEELHKRDMDFVKRFLTSYVRKYKKERNSR